MRLFIGIALPDAITSDLSSISLRYRTANDSLRWSSPESWHVTLQFLGSTSDNQYGCIVAGLRELRLPPVPVALDSLGFFDRPGIFYAGVRLTPELLSVQQRVTAATRPCGFVPETRDYHPHITLARSKGSSGRQGLRKLQGAIHRQPAFSGFTSEEFLLYESLPTPSGSRYEVRERFPLA